MLFVDSSVVLATLLAEHRRPPDEFWSRELMASQLLSYEVWNHVQRQSQGDLAASAAALLGRIRMVDLSRRALARAQEPFPLAVRTLDALHLATLDFLRREGLDIKLATFDRRMAAAAAAMGLPLLTLDELAGPRP